MKFVIVLCVLVTVVSADVSHLASNEYLPPHQQAASASAPAVSYSAPAVQYSATPATQSYHVEAASAPVVSYSAPVQSYHVEPASAPAASYSAPAASYGSSSYETAASEPAHTYSSAEGYRYKTNRLRVYRQRVRRDVSHLASSEYLPPHQFAASSPSNDYLPPVTASNQVAQYESAPSYSISSFSAPSYETAASYSTGSYSAPSYDAAASVTPAHTYSSTDGYRYKTAKRRVIRRRS